MNLEQSTPCINISKCNDQFTLSDLLPSQKEESALKSGVSVTDVMDTWTRQMGYPVVTVKLDRETKRITATQQRFLLNPRGTQMDEFKSPYGYVVEEICMLFF